MTPATARRVPAPLTALAALAALTLSVPLALLGTPSYAAPQDEFEAKITLNLDLIVKSDETYTVKMEMIDSSTGFEAVTKDSCTESSANELSSHDYYKNAKFTFKEEGNTRTCTIEGSGKVKDTEGMSHENGEFIIDTTSDSDSSSTEETPGLDMNYSVTFPGKVTEADGGKVQGNKVSFDDSMNHKVKGKDGSIPVWVWVLVGVGVVAVIGGGVAALLITRSKKNKSQPAYGAPVQGYDPNQAFPAQQVGQPDQQAGYGAPLAQPGQQAGFGSPQAQPGQSPYGGGQPGQPGQGAY